MTATMHPLTPADIPAAQRLRQQAGWNQTDADWRRLLAWDPAGCWSARLDGHVVGTTTVTSYGERIAWIGMVLVDEHHRRQGIGQTLLTHALAVLEERGIQTIALDSTPEGRRLYAGLGFTDAFELERWRGPIPAPPDVGAINRSPTANPPVGARCIAPADDLMPTDAAVRPLAPADLPRIIEYDARLFGVERGHILSALQADHPSGCVLAERVGRIVGYALSRPGARAWHLGPLAADDPSIAERLARAALLEASGPEMVLDVLRSSEHAVHLAWGLGLAPVRRFIRMTRGTPPPTVDARRLYTSAGPELG